MPGVVIGRDFRLDFSDDDGATFKVVGPVTVRDPSITNPTQDVTTQSTQGDYSEMNHTGYAQMAIAVSGIVKEVTGTDAATGLTLMTYKELVAIANASPVTSRKGFFRLIDTLESHKGNFLITEFGRTGGRSDIAEFSMALQNQGTITHSVLP